MMLVIASVFAGIVLVLGGIIAAVVLDSTLINAAIAQDKTGLKVVSTYPWQRGAKTNSKLAETVKMANNQLVNELIVQSNDFQNPFRNIKICVYEAVKADNAPSVVSLLKKSLTALGYPAEGYLAGDVSADDVKAIPVEQSFLSNLKWTDLPPSSAGENNRSFVVAGLPPLNKLPFPAWLMHGADIVIVVANASRQWKDIDKQLLAMVESTHGKKPLMVLNEVDPDHIKDYFGSIPFKSFIGRNRKKYR